MNQNVCVVDNVDFYDVTYISETLILPISFSFVYGLYDFMIFFKHMFMVNLFICIEFTLINGMVSPTELLNYTPKKNCGYRFGNIFLVFLYCFLHDKSILHKDTYALYYWVFLNTQCILHKVFLLACFTYLFYRLLQVLFITKKLACFTYVIYFTGHGFITKKA